MNRRARGGSLRSIGAVLTLAMLGATVLAAPGCRLTLRFDDRDAEAGTAGCVSDTDCLLTTLHCDRPSGQCVACVSDQDCTGVGRPRCDFALHRCVQCGVAQDCGSGNICEPTTRRCLKTCLSTAECPDDQTCDVAGGTCAECATSGDCTDRDRPSCDPKLGHCVACVDDDGCSDPTRHCDRTTGQCVGCTSSGDCGSSQLCDPASSTCVLPL